MEPNSKQPTVLIATSTAKNLFTESKKLTNKYQSTYSEIEEEDRKEEQANHKHIGALQEKVQKMMKQKEGYSELLANSKSPNRTRCHLVDPDCRLMKNRGRIEPCYNGQLAVDDKNHLIVDYNVTNAPADNCQLSSMAIGARRCSEQKA